MKLTSKLFWSVMLLAFVFAGCSKKNDSTSSGGSIDYVAPTLAKDTLIKIPSAMETKAQSDYNLASAVAQINLVNAFSTGLSSAFFYDNTTMEGWASKKNSDGSTTYSWKYLQYTVWLTYYHSSSESWWKYGEDSASYSLPFYYKDDKGISGETDWYDQNNFKGNSHLAYKDTWTKSGTTYNSTFNWYDNDGTTITTQYVSTSNADESGTLNVFEQNSTNKSLYKSWGYIWDKNGNGTYTNYNENGTVSFTGTF
jgi:hypothetical protein